MPRARPGFGGCSHGANWPAVGLAATTSIAGIFGMNLVSGIEEAPLAFAAVTLGSGLVGAAVVAGFHAAMRSQKSIERRARHAADDREALTALLANMATVENVFDDACRDLTRPAIAARLEAATGRAPSPREVEILFDIFDASQNDKISLREALSLDTIAAYTRKATGEKYLVNPSKA